MEVSYTRKGCDHYATAEAAEDAMKDLQDLKEAHGVDRSCLTIGATPS